MGRVPIQVLTSVGSSQPYRWTVPGTAYWRGIVSRFGLRRSHRESAIRVFSPRLLLALLALILGVNQQAELTVICQKGRRLMRTFTPLATGRANCMVPCDDLMGFNKADRKTNNLGLQMD